MRYVAVSRTDFTAPVQVLGVGETMDEAYAGARAWFDTAFFGVDSGDPRWKNLIILQNNLDAVTEDVLFERSGLGLDEWLTRLAAIGQGPGTPQPSNPWRDIEISRDRPTGWEASVWILAAIYFFSVPVFNLIYLLRVELGGAETLALPQLVVWVVVGFVSQAFFALIWFKIFQAVVGEDVSLAEFLVFLFLIRIAFFAAGYFFLPLRYMGVPV